MKDTTRRIEIPHGAVKKIADSLGYSLPTVRKALHFRENTLNREEFERAERIRTAAKNAHGGREVLISTTEG